MGLDKTAWAKIACLGAGLGFGVYWIPLRWLGDTGLDSPWVVLLFNLGPALLLLPWLALNWDRFLTNRFLFHGCCVLASLAYVTYASAFLYTEVVRVIVLFYLMPVWGFLLARVFMGEKITPGRWLAMILGVLGLLTIFGFEDGFPMPSNSGDWMALGSGFAWASASLLLLRDKGNPIDYTVGFLVYSSIWSMLFVVVAVVGGLTVLPSLTGIGEVLIWFVPFAILVLIPVAYATMFGPTQLNPGVAGLLFMTEISVGAVTAALFAGEPFGFREGVGVVLICVAGISETVVERYKRLLASGVRT